jgi:hypothetical protein
VTERPADLGGERDGRVDADEVEDEVRALVPGDVADGLGGGVIGDDRVIGAHGRGEFQRRRLRVDGHDRGRAGGLEDLDGNVPQAAGPDHHCGRAPVEQVQRALDGVVRREPGVGEGAASTGSRSPSGTSIVGLLGWKRSTQWCVIAIRSRRDSARAAVSIDIE